MRFLRDFEERSDDHKTKRTRIDNLRYQSSVVSGRE